MAGRFSDVRGRFGFIVCRKVSDVHTLLQRCKDILTDRQGCILMRDDTDLITLLKFSSASDEEGINDYLAHKLRQLVF